MIVFWISLAAILAMISIGLHLFVTRNLDPTNQRNSMVRFWSALVLRLVLIGVFFWQLVQQDFLVMIAGVVVFLFVYAGSLYYIIKKRPHWLQSEFKKESPAWMQ